jgi:hypothetical protein
VNQSVHAQPIQLQYVDREEISEAYADSLEKAVFDGNTVKLEFVVNRLSPPIPSQAPTGKKLTSCRVVLPLAGLIQMNGQIKNLLESLERQGVFKTTPVAPSSTTKN